MDSCSPLSFDKARCASVPRDENVLSGLDAVDGERQSMKVKT